MALELSHTMIGLRSMSLIVDHNGLFLALQRFLTFPNLVLSMGRLDVNFAF